jgi:uncharacterized membrane protein
MPWFDAWTAGSWFLFPMLVCIAMMVLMMGSHRMGGHHAGGHHMGDHFMGGYDDDRTRGDPALDTLRQRFASGELSPEEYEERKRALTA